MKSFWRILTVFMLLLAAGLAVVWLRSGHGVKDEAEQTRLELRKQGFKTDLNDFDSTSSAEMRERVAEVGLNGQSGPSVRGTAFDRTDLLASADERSAVVVWRQALFDSPPEAGLNHNIGTDAGRADFWEVLRHQVGDWREDLNAAAMAILSGPIRVNLSYNAGGRMLLPHLAGFQRLSDSFGAGTMVALHDNDPDKAWTNLLATTRLVTAWDVEPVEVSRNVQLSMLEKDYKLTWQALQSHAWPEERLAQLQREWESLDLFKGLPDTVAFSGASDVNGCRQERSLPMPTWPKGMNIIQHPGYAWSVMMQLWREKRYRSTGTYVDEKDMLLFYRDRELEMQKAIQCRTWAEMRTIPGVTTLPLFQSRYTNHFSPSQRQRRSQQRMVQLMNNLGGGLAERTAEAEGRRKVLIAAIAIERFHARYGTYPHTLAELTPDFLKSVPLDFMDGKPLRYSPTDNTHFFLYSVGLACVDDGGKMAMDEGPTSIMETLSRRSRGGIVAHDIVWPEPASDAEARARADVIQREAEDNAHRETAR